MRPKQDAIDEYLSSCHLWRKPMPKEDSLYRAVSEQLFMSQVHYLTIKEKVEKFIEENRSNMSCKLTNRLEFGAISFVYKCDIIVFQCRRSFNITQNDFQKKVLVCVTYGNQYDSVYNIEYKENAAICQAVLFEILYEKVFEVTRDVIDEGLEILHTKQKRHTYTDKEKLFLSSTDSNSSLVDRLLVPRPPFPYRVAKSLDPTLYRNIAYDVWVDMVKDGNDAGEPVFNCGDRCEVVLNEVVYHAHIQEFSPRKGPVDVFIEGLGRKIAVPFDSLKAIPQPVAEKKGKPKRRSLSFGNNNPRTSLSLTSNSAPDDSNHQPGLTQRTFLNSLGIPIRTKLLRQEQTRPRSQSFPDRHSSTVQQSIIAQPTQMFELSDSLQNELQMMDQQQQQQHAIHLPDLSTQCVQIPYVPVEGAPVMPLTPPPQLGDSTSNGQQYAPPPPTQYYPCVIATPPQMTADIQAQTFQDPVQYYMGVNYPQYAPAAPVDQYGQVYDEYLQLTPALPPQTQYYTTPDLYAIPTYCTSLPPAVDMQNNYMTDQQMYIDNSQYMRW
ncbi:OTU domain-containing protein CG3251-like [Tubulanus polymorphus]|uniref:OTU domain-containing protein CG3251-like n=1 Tax=Tubulanus polymorphus TaxID=672921 RepID=UPI003DA481A4